MMKITLEKVASFKTAVSIETDKKVNLIYGLNGTGKTTISNFLYRQNSPISDMPFADCNIEGINGDQILVYSQNFIRDNFYDQDNLKGIFTLSKENKEAEEEIKKAKQQIENSTAEKERLELQDSKQKEKLGDEEKSLRETKLWEIKQKYAGDKFLAFCLKGLQRKELVFDYITKITKPSIKPNKTIDDLKEESKAISDDAQRQDQLPKINIDIGNIENHTIFSEVIVGNEDSPVSTLIKKLDNSDWVKQGLDYLPDNSEQCPFCQETTITKQVVENIKNYFDETYDKQIKQIKDFKQQYNTIPLPEVTQYENYDFVKEDVDKFTNLYNKLKQTIDGNKEKIEAKLKEPSQKIELSNTTNSIQSLNDLIVNINSKVTEYNQKIDNKQQTKDTIKDIFWEIMRWNYDAQITQYEKNKQTLNSKIKEIKINIKKYDDDINCQNTTIRKQQSNTINIDEAIANINTGLNDLGIEGFSIKKYQEKYYRIVRDEQEKDNFKTLSEGEKMIISFLYFIELCKGKESEQDTLTENNKIIVIDDPISSLSHIYIFNISQLIKKVFFNEYKKVFVLTHSLYFFHELVKSYRKDKQLFRLTKSNTETQISNMEENEIQNDYQAYWQVIKDHDNNKANDSLLANSMRNILEHFFGFIDRNELKKVIEELDSNQFAAFQRYIDRESHSDLTNITDNKEIDAQLFKKSFRDVFDKSGYLKHYDKMMEK